MGSSVGVLLLLAGLALVVGGAELFFGGLLAIAARFRLSGEQLFSHWAWPD